MADFYEEDMLLDEDGECEGKAPNTNSYKTLIPLFVLDILEDNTNPFKQFTQDRIIEILDQYPYSAPIERRALSRDIQALMDEFPFIKKGEDGVYYDRHAA